MFAFVEESPRDGIDMYPTIVLSEIDSKNYLVVYDLEKGIVDHKDLP
jgi:hypothetical protein